MFDFQYVGRGCLGQDLAYCILGARALKEAAMIAYLEYYLAQLSPLLLAQGDDPPSLDELSLCCTLGSCDLARWMVGWNRQYWASFRRMMSPRCEPLLRTLDGGEVLPSEEAYLEAMFSYFPPKSVEQN